jgi:predicted ATPase
VAEERVVQVEGLAYPIGPVSLEDAEEFDAVRLFKLAAQRASPRFSLTAENLLAVVNVCQALDGTPLGLELAATWARFMPVDDLAVEISNNLNMLETSARDVPARHRSLKAAFEHSWRLLTPLEQEVLRRCSVFRGGFRREAAAEVVGATLPVLASLVNKSLLRVDASWRYDRHPLLYQFSEEKLAENAEELRTYQERHAVYFTRQMELWHRTDFLTNPTQWFAKCEADRANLDSAWRRCLDFGRTIEIYHVTIAWATYFEGRARLGEGARHLEGALSQLNSNDEHTRLARGAVLATLGVLLWRVGRLREGAQAGEEAVRLLGPLEAPYVRGWHMRWGCGGPCKPKV